MEGDVADYAAVLTGWALTEYQLSCDEQSVWHSHLHITIYAVSWSFKEMPKDCPGFIA